MGITIFTAEHCTPCQEIKAKIKDGDNVDVVDIETESGFARYRQEVLDQGDGFVPSAYRDGQRCEIHIENDQLVIECPSNDLPEVEPE